MRKYYLTLVSFILIFSVHSQNTELIGTWEGYDGEDIMQMTFDKDGFVYFTMDNETIGGPSYELDGVEAAVTYQVDTSKSPYWINFIITIKSDNSQFGMMLGIIEFSNDFKEMKISLDFGEGTGRPQSFTIDDTLLMMKID